jgi:hypothetical protein
MILFQMFERKKIITKVKILVAAGKYTYIIYMLYILLFDKTPIQLSEKLIL